MSLVFFDFVIPLVDILLQIKPEFFKSFNQKIQNNLFSKNVRSDFLNGMSYLMTLAKASTAIEVTLTSTAAQAGILVAYGAPG